MDFIYIRDVLKLSIDTFGDTILSKEAIESCEEFIKVVDTCVEAGRTGD